MSGFTIRRAKAGDEELALAMLRELAVYEKIEDRFKLTREAFLRDFVGPSPLCFCELAYVDAEPIGVMTWYRVYSSFVAARGIFLEDLYLRPVQRGQGYGRDLLAYLARQAKEDGAAYIEWLVLDWNKPSIDFYERLGAAPLKSWLSYRLSGNALGDLART